MPADAVLTAPESPAPVLVPAPSDDGGATTRTRRLALAAVLAMPFVANLVAIVGLVQYDPRAKTSGIGLIHQLGVLSGGQPYIDPNVGFNSYAMGHAAALAWLHGHVPWWTVNQGLGVPLAGSIQTAAFFPPTLLLALGQGSLWFHLCLELIAGWACYALLRELRCHPFAAAAGAIAFELNGSLAWLTNAPANPVPMLPMLILGVEWSVNAAGARRRGGWILLALGVWLTIVAGFPEVAILNAALAALWLVVRLLQRRPDALRILGRIALGGVTGLFLAAPLLNAFVRPLHLDTIGVHNIALADLSIPRTGLAMLVSPYVFGGIHDNDSFQVFRIWGVVGGYAGVMLIALGIGGIFGRRERWIRILLAAWAALFFGYMYDVPVLHQIVEHIPGLVHVAVYRYAMSSALFCLCVLAALLLDDLRTAAPFGAFLRMLPGIAVVLTVFTVGFLSTTTGRQWSLTHLPKWYWGSVSIFGAIVLVLGVAALVLLVPRFRPIVCAVLGGMLVIELFGFFEVPILAFPRSVTYDTGVVDYLRTHVGTQRYYTIGPVSPDFGAFYGIPSLDLIDLPVPRNWTNYVSSQLNECVSPWQFGNGAPLPNCAIPAYEEIMHAPAYEQSGVRYFVIGAKNDLTALFQPNLHGGATTPDGAARMVLAVRPPSFFPTGAITGFDLAVVGPAPGGLATTVCSARRCTTATPDARDFYGQHFTLARRLVLTGSATITLTASNANPLAVLTEPAVPYVPSTVTADGVKLADRSALLHFDFVAKTVPRLVFQTKYSRVYLLPHPSPLATAPRCRVIAHSITSLTTRCASASTLTWRELSFPGWTATVSGRTATIREARNHVFQQVALPKGTAEVCFSYEPPGALVAWILMALGAASLLVELVRRRAQREARGAQNTSNTPGPLGGPDTPGTPVVTT